MIRKAFPFLIATAIGVSVAACSSSSTPQNPQGIRQCATAMIKLHSDGITSTVLQAAWSGNPPAQDRVLAHESDMLQAKVCDLNDSGAQAVLKDVNAATGDSYTAVPNGN